MGAATSEGEPREPRTERGRRTLRAILDAAAVEFGDKGFHETSIVAITKRAGVALGSFYTYFESKDAVFRALVRDMSGQVGRIGAEAMAGATDPFGGEQAVLHAFLAFARDHKELYRIIDEAEFVDAAAYRAHYEGAARRIAARLTAGAQAGAFRQEVGEVEAWALMGMNVFLGLRFGIWGKGADLPDVADRAAQLLRRGLSP